MEAIEAMGLLSPFLFTYLLTMLFVFWNWPVFIDMFIRDQS